MRFGNVDINERLEWDKWSWKDFLQFYEHSLKGNIINSAEEIGKALGVKVPKAKEKGGDA
jgi:uncharacterized iron-regulated protein